MTGVEVMPNGDIRFSPEGLLTQCQVAQLLYNAYKNDFVLTAEVIELADVRPGAWYYDAVVWMVKCGLADTTTGSDGKQYFYPDQPTPRGYIAEALYRLANLKQVELPQTNPPISFTDMGDPAYAMWLPAVTALQRAGVIAGFPDGSFEPGSTLTREQTAVLMIRYTDILGLEVGTN